MNSETAQDNTHQFRRNAARASIIEAGRALAARVGTGELSLSAVAAEAGFGPSTVFGHFRNKDELLLAIVAEDLGSMAALMRGSLPSAVHETAPVEDAVSARIFDLVEVAPEFREQAANTQDETQNIVPLWSESPVAKDPELAVVDQEQGFADRPRLDAWLERRLRVFEHELIDLERRMKENDGAAARAVSLSEHGIKTLFDRMEAFEHQQNDTLHDVVQRLEETERRQRGVTAEMRAAVNDAATRIEILESARRGEQTSTFGARTSEPQAVAAPEPQPEISLRVQVGLQAADDGTYREAAQRAADAAATLVQIDRPIASESENWRNFARRRVRVSRKHYLAAISAALLAFLGGGFVAFYLGFAHGHDLGAAKAPVPIHVSAALHDRHAVAHTKPAASSGTDPRVRVVSLAQHGNPLAQLLVGLQYLRGEGTSPDQLKAAQWIRQAANQHEPLAQYWMGALYEHGDGVGADAAEAVRWYEAAAAQGNRKAMHALGVAYAQGMGTQKDYSAAARWFSKAAALGLVNSEFNLGVLYERGLGVTESLLDAYKWYAIAAAQGDQESGARVDILKTQLSGDSLAAAENAVQAFKPQPYSARANDLPSVAQLTSSLAQR
jgi:TPR repeat protein